MIFAGDGGDFSLGNIWVRVDELHDLKLKGGEVPETALREVRLADSEELGESGKVGFVEFGNRLSGDTTAPGNIALISPLKGTLEDSHCPTGSGLERPVKKAQDVCSRAGGGGGKLRRKLFVKLLLEIVNPCRS